MRDRSRPGSRVRFPKRALHRFSPSMPPSAESCPGGERGRGWDRAIGNRCLDCPEVSRRSWLEALQRSWSEPSIDSVGENRGWLIQESIASVRV